MDVLLNLRSVTLHHNLRDLGTSLMQWNWMWGAKRALGVSSESYGGLLLSILMNKLPSEIQLIISWELSEDALDLGSKMSITESLEQFRERSVGELPVSSQHNTTAKSPSAALSLVTDASLRVPCVYYNNPHLWISCPTVTKPDDRKQILLSMGHRFICLRWHHISRNCCSNMRSSKCKADITLAFVVDKVTQWTADHLCNLPQSQIAPVSTRPRQPCMWVHRHQSCCR